MCCLDSYVIDFVWDIILFKCLILGCLGATSNPARCICLGATSNPARCICIGATSNPARCICLGATYVLVQQVTLHVVYATKHFRSLRYLCTKIIG